MWIFALPCLSVSPRALVSAGFSLAWLTWPYVGSCDFTALSSNSSNCDFLVFIIKINTIFNNFFWIYYCYLYISQDILLASDFLHLQSTPNFPWRHEAPSEMDIPSSKWRGQTDYNKIRVFEYYLAWQDVVFSFNSRGGWLCIKITNNVKLINYLNSFLVVLL